MKRNTLAIMSMIILLFTVVFSINTNAGEAGVGVLNVPPEYSNTRIVQEDGLIKIYLTISDYNSWGDIYSVNVITENNDVETARFLFKQYENPDSLEKTNEFAEILGKDLLITDQCSYSHSDKADAVADRCRLDLLFVFYPIACTRLSIVTQDRGGLTATTHIDYAVEGMLRSSKTITLPWTNTPIEMSVYTIDAIALALAITSIAFFIRKNDVKKGVKEV